MNEDRFRAAERRLWESFGVTPTERRVRLDRHSLSVRIQEVGEGPPVLFVHGASNGGASWASLVSQLEGFHCLLLDRPGCALSDPLAGGLADLAAIGRFADTMIPDVLDALGLSSAFVVSTSYGGYFALRAAAAHPDRIDRLLEFGWTIGAPMAKAPLAMRVGATPLIGWVMARVPPPARAVRMILRQVGLGQALDSGRFTQESIDWFVSLLRDTPTMRNEFAASPQLIRPIHGFNERVELHADLLGRVCAPVRFVWGEEDPNGGAEAARPFVARFPDATLELMPGVGHAPWIDDPDHAAAEFREFFS